MHIHFISIGGAVMHNLAVALHKKGNIVTGSDDEIFNPAKDRLQELGLLPEKFGWYAERITKEIDAIILGMHAKEDNPELIKARKLGFKIFSFPEFLFEQTKNKKRVVIGGSHGKTTITSIIMHVLKYNNIEFDYMVGAQIDGFETMVGLSDKSEIAVFEGDEYLSSAIDKRPKFHLYKPHIALISGIAWDHINVFPTFENYLNQFKTFIDLIEENGKLIYFNNDKNLKEIVQHTDKNIEKISYKAHLSESKTDNTLLIHDELKTAVQLFGEHNMQNIQGAKLVCDEIGITDEQFYNAIQSFKGASKRLQLLASNRDTKIYQDFAHAPSKLVATIKAMKSRFKNHRLIACIELHTYSSLNKKFLIHYKNSMNNADHAIVFYSPEAVKLKKLEEIEKDFIANSFNHKNLVVFSNSDELKNHLLKVNKKNTNLLLMSSGNFEGINLSELAHELLSN